MIEKEKNISTALDIDFILAEDGDIDGIEQSWPILQWK
jgi:hypothetical protein